MNLRQAPHEVNYDIQTLGIDEYCFRARVNFSRSSGIQSNMQAQQIKHYMVGSSHLSHHRII